MMSLLLLYGFRFRYGGGFSVEALTNGGKVRYVNRSYGHHPAMQSSYLLPGAHHVLGSGELRPKALRAIFGRLDRYYRPYYFYADRIATALNFLWAAAFTPFDDLAFLSLSTTLEALLSTSQMEISHTLAERVAVLLEKQEEPRLIAYKQAKKLYDIRSKLTHGDIRAKKGVQNLESLFVTAKRAIVPHSGLVGLAGIVIRVLRAVLQDDELRTVLQSEDTAKLHELYLRRGFSRRH